MITIWTYDWVPPPPRGFVRDLRLRWACEEGGLDYTVKGTPFENRGAEHFAHQPFGQIPFIEDGDIQVFESGACLIYLARKTDRLMPSDLRGETAVMQWIIAALNSIEIVSVSWAEIGGARNPDNKLTGWLDMRLGQLDKVLAEREWLVADRFTAADIMVGDVLRQTPKDATGKHGAIMAYVEKLKARPAFQKAYAEQLAFFAKGDEARAS
ncbi:glutathione S-transferase family protein [Devosia sediminis]|uniref:Glutathione S-transferase family protein n=1 Tax=Devosia sediminis TaxID=2798801 RepID=A0A934ML21_9HYPH|nr:glutathione S-transferase family protein [Devosia sediminis]MBJ3785763.1 glutathione S-transferase family protein [Devosia sediminis]